MATAVPLPAGYASAPAAAAVALPTVTAPERAPPPSASAAPLEAPPPPPQPPALASFLAPTATAVGSSAGSGSGASPPKTTFEGALAGEHVVEQVKSCSLLVQNPFCEVAGRLQMTPYRLKFMIPKGSLRTSHQRSGFRVSFGASNGAIKYTTRAPTKNMVFVPPRTGSQEMSWKDTPAIRGL